MNWTRAALLVLLFPSLVHSGTIIYICDYPRYSDINGSRDTKGEYRLTFMVDTETSEAYMAGNVGTADVKVYPREGGISFIEFTKSGNIMTTAIDSKGNSVHSRNTILFGELEATQYHGSCEVRE